MHIPDDIIANIKNSADIVDIVSEVVRLKKAGKNYLGLCPFHSEKTPSFTVSPDKQMFHCFGCGEGGSVFTFLMKHQGLGFPEAVALLAKRCGIALPRQEKGSPEAKDVSERQRLLSVMQRAAAFYHSCLREGPGGERAVRYMAERGLSDDMVRDFHLGYAPGGWDALTRFLSKHKIPMPLAEQAGLVVLNREGSGYYDRFRNRIIFPITDLTGRVIALGGRVMDDTLPKYLNSPETPLYSKSHSLYGLSHTKQMCRQAGTVYITEGYMDFLSLYRHGIRNVVATLGTALTAEHLRMLKGFVTKAVLVFDSDAAGIKAAQRSIEIFNGEKGIQPFILVLPTGHDPDSYVRENGAQAFETLAGKAGGAMSFLLESAVNRHGLSLEGKIRVMSDLEESLAAVEDGVARSLYVKEVSERLGIEESAVLEKVRQAAARRRSRSARPSLFTVETSAPGGDQREEETTASVFGRSLRMERQLLSMMLHVPEMISEIESRNVLSLFADQRLKTIGTLLVTHRRALENRSVDIVDVVPDESLQRIVSALCVGDELCMWNETGCRKLIGRFVDSRLRHVDTLSHRIKAAEENRDGDLLDHLLKAKQEQVRNKLTIEQKGESAL
ncbi:MAG: DNA primase [Thermodesulfobacteriota bacterium]|nr:DNA primase [Thermodesulfobacteriota bacterium]